MKTVADPKHCFCSYSFDEILEVARRKYLLGFTTVELLALAITEHERDVVAITSLLDVPNDDLKDVLDSKTLSGDCHLHSCRRMLRKMIRLKLGMA